MISFTVNGKKVTSDQEKKKLLPFLRDELRLTSVKDGCAEGACGTCTVLIDGKATRACVPTLSKLEGKKVVTMEGLSEREKEVYAYAFAKAGAVQCGFCIPGMVISAKGLLDVQPSPGRDEIKKALRGNICRCTGYVKIEDAVLTAAELLREGLPVPESECSGRLGESLFRLDARDKTLGAADYVDDLVFEDMVYAKALRSKYPRAKILSIDSTRAEAHPRCLRVIRAEDIPGNKKCGHLKKDWDALFGEGEITRFVGDSIVLVVTDSKESLDEVLDLVEVRYEELTPVLSPAQGLEPGAPELHEGGNLLRREVLDRGDADAAIASAPHVVTRHYSLPFTEHAFMEPECAIGLPDGNDGVLLYTASQSIYDEQHEVASLLGLPYEKVNVHSQFVGGGFGGKEDMVVQHHAALAAWLVKRPVKVRLSRQESLMIHPKRHAMEIECTTACDEKGMLLAAKFDILADTGAYASLGGPVLQRACTHAGGPYHFKNFYVQGRAVYTNNVPAGAFRGFGVTQSAFAMECNLNLLAEKVGISPWEIRYRNAVRPGQVLPNGQIADDSTGLVQCLEAVKEAFEKSPYAGVASSFKNAGVGVGVADTGRCIISVEKGRLHIRSSAACIGQGMATVMVQMACETLGLAPDLFVVEAPDTRRTPDSGTTTASRQTLLTGEAVVRAARLVKQELDKGRSLEQMDGEEFFGEYLAETDPMGSDKEFPVSHVAYGYAAQVVELDREGRVTHVTAAYDVGRVVNPVAAQGQIEGGVAMGLGYGLTEDFPMENGYVKAKYGTLGLFRATETPPITVHIVKKDWYGPQAYGAKGVGELATIPTAPAAQGAYYRLDGVFRTRLPLADTFYKKAKKTS